MAELADALDLGSSACNGRGSSSLPIRTNNLSEFECRARGIGPLLFPLLFIAPVYLLKIAWTIANAHPLNIALCASRLHNVSRVRDVVAPQHGGGSMAANFHGHLVRHAGADHTANCCSTEIME